MTSITPGPDQKLYFIPLAEFLDGLRLTPQVKEFFFLAKKIAEKQGKFLYLAGGQVRDFFLKRPSFDVDLVLEGEAEDFLEALQRSLGIKIILKTPFLTYKLQLGEENLRVDLACAREEIYEGIAVLPKVRRSTYREDILRRDFTINALIYGLTTPFPQQAVDLVSGLEDLRKGVVRPLHLNSFVDDPTRAFRGIRYLVRFDFQPAFEFLEALERGKTKGAFWQLSSSRLRNELALMVKKENPELLARLVEKVLSFGLFQSSGLMIEENKILEGCRVLQNLKDLLNREEMEEAFFLILSGFRPENLRRLFFTEAQIAKILKIIREFQGHQPRFLGKPLIERVLRFENLSPGLLVALIPYMEDLSEEVKRFLLFYRHVQPLISGEDLLKLGIPSGQRIGQILRLLRQEKIEGRLQTREEELNFVRHLLSQGF